MSAAAQKRTHPEAEERIVVEIGKRKSAGRGVDKTRRRGCLATERVGTQMWCDTGTEVQEEKYRSVCVKVWRCGGLEERGEEGCPLLPIPPCLGTLTAHTHCSKINQRTHCRRHTESDASEDLLGPSSLRMRAPRPISPPHRQPSASL
jgi:hypothetical protein